MSRLFHPEFPDETEGAAGFPMPSISQGLPRIRSSTGTALPTLEPEFIPLRLRLSRSQGTMDRDSLSQAGLTPVTIIELIFFNEQPARAIQTFTA